MRVFYIILANLSIPFLLFYLRNIAYKIYFTVILKQPEKDVPKLNLKNIFNLLVVGVALLASMLFFLRWQAPTETLVPTYKVKEYNFRK